LKKQKILVQLPEGLKTKAVDIASDLEKNGAQVVVCNDPCFGACDLKFLEGFKTMHYGHSKMLEKENVEYKPWRMQEDCVPVALKAVPLLPSSVGLAATIQHSHQLENVKKALQNAGLNPEIIPQGVKCSENGQVLGCDFTGALKIKDKVDAFLFIGSGVFHPLGLAYYTGKKVVRADPLSSQVEEVDATEWVKGKSLRQTKAINAKTFGIIVSWKPGQKNLEKAFELKKTLEKQGFQATVFIMDEITPEKLLGLKVDAFVVTACPRIVIDDWKNYDKPLLLPSELPTQ
jgi:2-(3-amino-3-carboxypropyl)histidine synthase